MSAKKTTPTPKAKEFTFDDASHTYYLDGKALTGVTSVLNVISKPALIGWAAKMATEYLWDNRDRLAQTTLEGKLEYDRKVFLEAKGAHNRKKDDAATKGTDIHSLCEEWINACIESYAGAAVAPPQQSEIKQLQDFIEWAVTHNVTFLASEKKMYSESLWLAGTCDFVAIVDGKKLLGDIKTTSGIYDLTPFLQCAAYRLILEEMGEKDFEGSVIVRLGKDGSFEERYRYDFETDKKGFLAAMELYRALATYKK